MPDPVLYARNETEATVTFNNRYLNWELPPYPDPNYIAPLPWDVAIANGFDRLWDSGAITVALDREFVFQIDSLPSGAALNYQPVVHLQTEPQASTVIKHDFNRPGPVMAVVTSPGGEIVYFNVDVETVDMNNCRINFEDPLPFLATIF